MRKINAALVLGSMLWLAPASAQQSTPLALRSFEFLGCSGDWEGTLTTPEVWRLTADGQVTFLTHTLAACGLSGRNPAVAAGTDLLDLSYELYSPTDVAIMCECEYWAKFTFGPEAHTVKSISVGGEQAVRRGTWPGL